MSIRNFIADIWNAALMEAMYESHIFTQPTFVNRNYEGQVFNQGDTVHITGIEPVNIGSYTRYTDIEFEQINDNKRTLSIDQADFFGLTLDDLDKAQEIGDTMGPAMREAGYKMSRAADIYVATVMSGNVASDNVLSNRDYVDGSDDANGRTLRHTFVDLRTRLARNNVPETGRWAIVTPEIYAIILRDPQFIQADLRGQTGVVENGFVGRMYGFDIYESNNAPTTPESAPDAGDGSHTILAGQGNSAMTYADGLSQTEAGRFEKRFADYVKGLHVYGGKVLRPETLCKVDVVGLAAPATPVTFRDTGWVDDPGQDLPDPGSNDGSVETSTLGS